MDLARHAIEADEEIGPSERIIEDLCLKLLLQQQPVAKDLRLISSALKMITDSGAQSAKLGIFQKSQLHWQTSRILRNWNIQQMAKETMIMLVGSIEAFVDKETGKRRMKSLSGMT